MTDVNIKDGNNEHDTHTKLKIPDTFLVSTKVEPKSLPPRPKRPSIGVISNIMKKNSLETPIKTETKPMQELQVKQEQVSTSPRIARKQEQMPASPNTAAEQEQMPKSPNTATKQEQMPKSPNTATKQEQMPKSPNTATKQEQMPKSPNTATKQEQIPKSPNITTKQEKCIMEVNILGTDKPIAYIPKEQLVENMESVPVVIESQDIDGKDTEYEYKQIETNLETFDLFFSSPTIESPLNQIAEDTDVKENDTIKSEEIKDKNVLSIEYQSTEASPIIINNQVPAKQEAITDTDLTEDNNFEETITVTKSGEYFFMSSYEQTKEKTDGVQPRPPRPAKSSIVNVFQTNIQKEKTKINAKELLERSKHALTSTAPSKSSEKTAGKSKENNFKDRVKNFDNL